MSLADANPWPNPLERPDAYCAHGYVKPEAAHPAAELERCPECGPSDADVAARNLSKAAEQFEVYRHIVGLVEKGQRRVAPEFYEAIEGDA